MIAALYVFLRVVPGAAGVGHVYGQQHAGDQGTGQQPAQSGGAQQYSHQQRHGHRHDAGDDHLVEGGPGGDGHAGAVVRAALALQYAGYLPELAADLLYHLIGGLGHRVHGESGEGKGQHAADEQPYDHIGGEQVDAGQLHLGSIGDEQGQGGEGGGADGKALAYCGGGVAHGIQLVRYLPDAAVQPAHLGNAAGVVGNGAVGVHRHGDAGGGEHAHGGQGYAVEVAGDAIGYIDAHADEHYGHPGAAHAHRHAADYGGGGAGLGLAGNALYAAEVLRGVDLGDKADDQAHHQAGGYGPAVVHAAEKQLAEDKGGNSHYDRGHIGAHFQGLVGVGPLFAPDEEGGDYGGQDADAGHHQGVYGPCALEQALSGHAQSEGGDYGPHVAFKEVGAHACHVTHIVTHIVGDDGGVAGVVLRNTGLHLAHQVGAHVGGLGVDTAAHTGEKGYGGGAQGESEEYVVIAGDYVYQAAAQKTQAHHAHAHDGAAGKGDGQGLYHAALHGGVGGADIGPGGHPHAEKAGQHGEPGADHKANGCA